MATLDPETVPEADETMAGPLRARVTEIVLGRFGWKAAFFLGDSRATAAMDMVLDLLPRSVIRLAGTRDHRCTST